MVEPDPTRVTPGRAPLAPHELVFRRAYDLPPAIVWDALADPVLISGWLGDARIDPHVGGRYHLRFRAPLDRQPGPLGECHVTRWSEPYSLEFESTPDRSGDWVRVRFVLEDVPGGPRNRSTLLHLSVGSPFATLEDNRQKAAWMLHLDLLRELLHGHPVDWARWQSEFDDTWQGYLDGFDRPER